MYNSLGGDRMNTKKIGLVVAALTLLAIGYFVFIPPATQLTNPQSATSSGTSQVTQVEVMGSDFKFNPAQISLQAGEKVKLIFKNTGEARHDFVIEGLNTRTKLIAPGTSDTVEFTAPDTGTYTFYCSVPGHRQAGMEGKLVTN